MAGTGCASGELVERKVQASPWHFWQYFQPQTSCYYLYALLEAEPQADRALHLGAFAETGSLAAQLARFLEEPHTTVALELDPDLLKDWLAAPATQPAPRFAGQFGTPWSGYGIKPIDEQQVEVIYAADRRHEWLGVFSEVEAFAYIELDYDRRRRRCLIC
ncbi:hypothetical protein [Marinospirillum sp.]|uniref:hypothetical protein n=1 Tax=Marinospirillum sp. TaxID=2183934 RepID=UPI002870696B|nr:hypothetical protein [Marinospirillum sp.]MDR9467711.1 hypothetical protein [Marinospirillum sp.]